MSLDMCDASACRYVRSLAVLLGAVLIACGSSSSGTRPDANGLEDAAPADAGSGPDARSDVGADVPASGPDAPFIDAASDVVVDGAADLSVAADSAMDAPTDVTDMGADLGTDTITSDVAPADTAPACSPAPDRNGFFASCSACPNPGDCDTIDVNGSRRYACGCSGGCPCGLRCGSYVIPGTGISIGSICVR
jgi:hypothetical protein